jgi:hypothetical protein
LSSTIFCFLARSAFDGWPFFGGILTGCYSLARERRRLGGGRWAAGEGFLGLGLEEGEGEDGGEEEASRVAGDLVAMWVAEIG